MQYTCIFCKKQFDSKNSLQGHYGHCPVARETLYKSLPKDVLEDLYINKGYSANYIGGVWMKEHNGYHYGPGTIIHLLHEYGIPTRTLDEANRNPERQKIYKETIKTKYGEEYTNISQLKDIKEKKENTFFKHYGMRNIFCDSKYISRMFENKYGAKYNVYRKDWVSNRNNGVRSNLHKEIENILKTYDITFISEYVGDFLKYNEELERYYNPRPDILIPDKKIIIEVQGDSWHANPKIYKKDDIIDAWDGEVSAEQIWRRDDIRKRHLESFGYKVIYIWEHDIKHNIGGVKCQIKKLLKSNQ